MQVVQKSFRLSISILSKDMSTQKALSLQNVLPTHKDKINIHTVQENYSIDNYKKNKVQLNYKTKVTQCKTK